MAKSKHNMYGDGIANVAKCAYMRGYYQGLCLSFGDDKLTIAKYMKQADFDLKLIAEKTGLTLQEIQDL